MRIREPAPEAAAHLGFGQLVVVQPWGGLSVVEKGDNTPHRTSLDLWLSEETHWGKHGGSGLL